MDVFDKIIRENCWKFNKGYPDSQEDINYLKLKINNSSKAISSILSISGYPLSNLYANLVKN